MLRLGIARASECQCEAIHLLSPPSAFVAEQGAHIEMLLCSPMQAHTAGMSNLCFGLVVNTASPRQSTCCFHHRLRGKENSLKCCCVLPLQEHTGCAVVGHIDSVDASDATWRHPMHWLSVFFPSEIPRITHNHPGAPRILSSPALGRFSAPRLPSEILQELRSRVMMQLHRKHRHALGCSRGEDEVYRGCAVMQGQISGKSEPVLSIVSLSGAPLRGREEYSAADGRGRLLDSDCRRRRCWDEVDGVIWFRVQQVGDG
jgi:hypothetical protein